jgi:RNA polymerase sigma factor (TIGR02999 family)
MQPDSRLVTGLLHQWKNGDGRALDELMPYVYDELRRLSARCLSGERADHTMRATELVHEAYLHLMGANVDWQDRIHFYAVAARVMRRILVDYAKNRGRQKRGGGVERVPLDESVVIGSEAETILVELDEALERLAANDRRKSEIVQLLFFGGMTYDETAAALEISPATVHRELKMAKAWLYRELAQSSN